MAKKRTVTKRKGPAMRIPVSHLAGFRKIFGGKIPAGAMEQIRREYRKKNPVSDWKKWGAELRRKDRAMEAAERKHIRERQAMLKRDKKAQAAWIKSRKKKNPAKRRRPRRKNQEDHSVVAAEKMFKKFHGRKASRVDEVEQLRVTPDALADLGRLVELVIDTGAGGRRLPFGDSGRVRVASTHDGGQLYFVKGDQQVDVSKFPAMRLPKDHVDLGELDSIVYFTSKDFHNFEPSEYEHHFGLNDDTGAPRGRRPSVHYDVHSKRLYLTGGTYRVKREGIVG